MADKKRIRVELLEFMENLLDIEPYISADMYHQISEAFWHEDGKGIINALMSLCKLISNLRDEIRRMEEEKEEIRKALEKCMSEKEKCLSEYERQRQEMIDIRTGPFSKYFLAKSLYEDGYSLSRVAKQLGVNRETAKKYLTALQVKIRENKSSQRKSPVKDIKKDDDFYPDIDDVANGII